MFTSIFPGALASGYFVYMAINYLIYIIFLANPGNLVSLTDISLFGYNKKIKEKY